MDIKKWKKNSCIRLGKFTKHWMGDKHQCLELCKEDNALSIKLVLYTNV